MAPLMSIRWLLPALFTRADAFSVAWQKAAFLGLNLELRKPPVLTEKETAGFTGPVFMMAAEDDVFFPAAKGIARCRKLFKGFREAPERAGRVQARSGARCVPAHRGPGRGMVAIQINRKT